MGGCLGCLVPGSALVPGHPWYLANPGTWYLAQPWYLATPGTWPTLAPGTWLSLGTRPPLVPGQPWHLVPGSALVPGIKCPVPDPARRGAPPCSEQWPR